jgi:DNA modification methylase
MFQNRIFRGDCREVLRGLPENSFDAVVTDPPYELGFMGKSWDSSGVAFDPETWKEVLRVLKPGGHLLAFGGSRTSHRITCAIEDAGFEIRDVLQWIYGSGFPKSLDVSKAIDKAAGAEREVLGPKVYGDGHIQNNTATRNGSGRYNLTLSGAVDPNPMQTAPATAEAKQWQGWGTALKPAYENITVARKPLNYIDEMLLSAREITESILCLLRLHAKGAGAFSPSSLSVLDGVLNSAQWNAAGLSNTPGALHGRTAMLRSVPELENTNWSTVLLWLDTLADLSQHANRFTTETALSLTTDLRIWKFYLSQITPESIAQSETLQSGDELSVFHATNTFRGVRSKLDYTLGLFAGGPVISPGDAPGSPANVEAIVMARKPLSEKTVAKNVLLHGTGGINVDACRINPGEPVPGGGGLKGGSDTRHEGWKRESHTENVATEPHTAGRWPSNVLLSEEAAAELDLQTGTLKSGSRKAMKTAPDEERAAYGRFNGTDAPAITGNEGGASRFFYCAKASKSDRNRGMEPPATNTHSTVKPLAVMEWLVTLVTPPGGIVLDPFTGSGSTLCAAAKLGFSFLGCELTAEYIPIAEARVRHYAPDTVTITPEIAAPVAEEVELLDFAL